MEKHYEEKLEAMRREMEMQNERENSRLKQELEKVKSSAPITIPSLSDDEDFALNSPGADNDPYNIMKSIAFAPVVPPKGRSRSFNITDITGERAATGGGVPDNSSDSCSVGRSRSSSPFQSPPPKLPLLSPATGQQNSTTSTCIEEEPLSPQMKELLGTYELVETSSGVPHTVPMDMPDGSPPQYTTSGMFDIGYVTRNLTRFQVDSDLSKSCPTHATDNGIHGATNAEPE